jgi:hypothetical protein
MGQHVVSFCFCTADGRVLAIHSRDEPGVVRAFNAWQRLPAGERKPGGIMVEDRGRVVPRPPRGDGRPAAPPPPPDGLQAHVYFRALVRDGADRLDAPAKMSVGISKTVVNAEPNGDFFWLTAAECRSLIPDDPKRGARFPLPETIRTRLCRFHLVDGACCLPGFWQPQQVYDAKFDLTVQDADASEVKLRLNGSACVGRAAPGARFGVTGYLRYDRRARRFTQFDVVALSDGFHKDVATGKPMMLGIAFELVPTNSPERLLPPYRVWYDGDGLKDYFGTVPEYGDK